MGTGSGELKQIATAVAVYNDFNKSHFLRYKYKVKT